ncbi:hypothetical protein Tco_1472117, partial [Tanacetum coccineum]
MWDRNGRRSEDEESKNPFFKGDGSSLFAEPEEWEDDGVADDNYKESLVLNDDQYEDDIEEEEGFVDNYPNFQEDENNVSCSGVVLFYFHYIRIIRDFSSELYVFSL